MSSPSEQDEEFELKRERIITAVECNRLDSLRILMNSPEFYKIINDSDETLLQAAIMFQNEEIFDYLLSLDDFPFDCVNNEGETALVTSLRYFGTDDLYMSDHFALELIHKGADINKLCFEGDSLLHCAVKRDYVKVAQILIDKGLDVNRQNDKGYTPLHVACFCCSNEENSIEIVSMLLYHGADPTIQDGNGLTSIDFIVRYCDISALECFNYYLFDEYSRYDIHAGILLKAAQTESPFVDPILENIGKVVNNDSAVCNPEILFTMKPKYLQVFVEKFDHVRELLQKESENCFLHVYQPIFSENFYVLAESNLKLEFIDWLCNVVTARIIGNFIQHKKSESSLTELVCFLLSYGATVYTKDLCVVFKNFGYCELFKILVHMDITGDWNDPRSDYMPDIMARLLCDVQFDIQKIIDDPLTLSARNLKEIMPFYAIPKLKCIFGEDTFRLGNWPDIRYLHEKLDNQPQIPLLVELARNTFRKYFIQKLGIANSRQFYTLLDQLPISKYHKKVITLEEKLYDCSSQ